MSWLFGGRKGHDPNAAAPARQPPAGGVPPGVGMQQDVRHQVQDAGAGGYHPAAGGYQPVPQPAPRVQHQIPQHQIPQQHVPQQQHQQQHHHHHQTPPQPSHLGTPPTFQRHKSDGATLRVGALKYPALDMIEVSVKAGARILAMPSPPSLPLPPFIWSGVWVQGMGMGIGGGGRTTGGRSKYGVWGVGFTGCRWWGVTHSAVFGGWGLWGAGCGVSLTVRCLGCGVYGEQGVGGC